MDNDYIFRLNFALYSKSKQFLENLFNYLSFSAVRTAILKQVQMQILIFNFESFSFYPDDGRFYLADWPKSLKNKKNLFRK